MDVFSLRDSVVGDYENREVEDVGGSADGRTIFEPCVGEWLNASSDYRERELLSQTQAQIAGLGCD